MTPDVIVIGSGPNGLAAAIVLAQAGRSVTVYEAQPTMGGGARSAELTLPGFVHDTCSAVHPFAIASPFFRSLPLASHGLEWIDPPVALAHPFDEGPPAVVRRSVAATAATLGVDAGRYDRLVGAVVRDWARVFPSILAPLGWPRHPLAMARFGLQALRSAEGLARGRFTGAQARGLFAGIAAHGMLPLDYTATAAFGLVLGAAAHVVGWPIPRGGAQRISDALAAHLRSLGGTIVTGTPVRSIDELAPARLVLCDLSPRPLLRIAGHRFPDWYRRRLERYRYGMGAFKVDYALAGPIPWRDAACAEAGTVHLGGTLEAIAHAEQQAWSGVPPERPFVLLSQPTTFDPSRAPDGRHVAWAYCHVPHASRADMLDRMEAQIERFAPGFRDQILARSVMDPAALEAHNANYVGGDIGSGASDIRQLFVRPSLLWHGTPVKGLYLCSASTPPGVGVHGMCGYFAARRALVEEI
jgi:phytoene dehydrogenase-like protein